MCDFISGFLRLKKRGIELLFSDLRSHRATAEFYKLNLAADSARELEWTEDRLEIRRHGDDPDENTYKAALLAEFPARDLLIEWALNNLPPGVKTVDARGCTALKELTLPAGVKHVYADPDTKIVRI